MGVRPVAREMFGQPELRTVAAMKILDPLSGREVDLHAPYRASLDANASTPSVRVPHDEVRSTPLLKAASWRPDAELQTFPGARASPPLRGSQKRSVVLTVVLAALCIWGWGAFGYKSWSSAAAEREKLALITASEAAREDLGSELKRLRDRVGDLRAVQEKLAATREELKRTTTAREDAASQLVGFQREVAAISSRLEKTKDRVVVTGGIKKAEPPRRPR
jgi:hypothetical protein